MQKLFPAFSCECTGQGHRGLTWSFHITEECGMDLQAGSLSRVLEGRSEGCVPATGCQWGVSHKSRVMGWYECAAVMTVAGKSFLRTH